MSVTASEEFILNNKIELIQRKTILNACVFVKFRTVSIIQLNEVKMKFY